MLNRRKPAFEPGLNGQAGDEERQALVAHDYNHRPNSATQVTTSSPFSPNGDVPLPNWPTTNNWSAPRHNREQQAITVRRHPQDSPSQPNHIVTPLTLHGSPTSYVTRPIQAYPNHSSNLIELNSYQPDSHYAIEINNRSSQSHSKHSSQNFVFYTIQPGDTLQNLSVRYSCPIASIKRLNNFWSDQDFFGLSQVKLPLGKLGLLADAIDHSSSQTAGHNAQHNESNVGTTNAGAKPKQSDSTHRPSISLDDRLDHDFVDPRPERKGSVFKNLDLNIERVKEAARYYDNNANSIMQTLADRGDLIAEHEHEHEPCEQTKRARQEADSLLRDMSDSGLSYNGLILFIFIVCLVCPVAYILYLEETHHEYNKLH